ncbi:MAG: type II secretion system F family protein [Lachnospiraceae bacterium]|nr:type II secretion system F family protein [Lachnospiraceae bacterium]
MASFKYTAVDMAGKKKSGTIEADNQAKVNEMLKKDGLTPVEVKAAGTLDGDINLSFLRKRVGTRDLSLFCRQFVSMHSAGVTILETMKMLAEQTENPTLKGALNEVYLSVQKGETLANSMRTRGDVFPKLLIHMVEAGEASGSLEIAFERMAVQFEKSAKIQGMVKKTMVYPIMVLVVAVVVVVVMLVWIVPTFMSMFADMEIAMPKITLAVVAASDFIKDHWLVLIIVIGLIVVGIKLFVSKTVIGEEIVAKAALRIPLFGDLTTKQNSAKFARNLSTMLAAGISMPEAVEITAETMANKYFIEAMRSAKEDVMQGVPLSTPLEKSGLFPPMVCHMTRIGEETGNIESMLDTLADYYEEEVEVATEALMAALEPLMIIMLAGVCGVIIGAVLAPMASMYQGLDAL